MNHVRHSTMTVRIVAAVVGLAFVLSLGAYARFTYALTQAEVDVICALVSCDADTKAALSALVTGGTSGGTCPVLTQPLTVGAQGTAVVNLQNYLIGNGRSIPAGATGYFGTQTKAAVAAWQTANGVMPALGYWGPISLAKYNSICTSGGSGSGTGSTPTTGGAEGGIVVTQEGSPSNGTDLHEGETKVVSAFEIEADDDSAMTVNRVDVNFSHRPWLYVDTLALYCDGDLLEEEDGLSSSDFTEITSGSDYRWRLSGLNHSIPAGEEQRCEVEATAISGSDKTDTTITITHAVDSVRASDTSGLQHEEPSTAFTRTFDFQDEEAATLNVTLHGDEPDDAIVVDVSDSGTTDDVVLCELNIEAEQQDSFLNGFDVQFGVKNNDAQSIFDELRVEDDDGNVLETATSVGTTSRITGFDPDVELPQDEKVHLRIVAEVKDTDDVGLSGGFAASTTILSTTIDAEDAGFDDVDVSGLSNVLCEDRHFYEDAPIFTLTDDMIEGIDDGSGNTKKADATLEVRVTAGDTDVYLHGFGYGGWIASSTPAASSTTGDFTSGDASDEDATAEEIWKIPAGSSRNFTFTARLDQTNGSGTIFSKLDTASFTYGNDTTVGDADDVVYNFGIDDFETDLVTLEP
jgi:hypothetical protein